MKRMFIGVAMMLASLPALAQASSDPPKTISVQLSNFDFAPKRISLEHGQAYVLHLVNSADGGHNFDAEEFFALATIDTADRAKVRGGRIEVPGHAAVDVHFTAPSAGSYPLRCTHFGHALLGMRGKLVVQ